MHRVCTVIFVLLFFSVGSANAREGFKSTYVNPGQPWCLSKGTMQVLPKEPKNSALFKKEETERGCGRFKKKARATVISKASAVAEPNPDERYVYQVFVHGTSSIVYIQTKGKIPD